jgi:energy-coupling factor transporter ATP-binding protein EcfA2
VTTNIRFSRSANVERDHGDSAIDGYVPTGRAVDVISRVAAGLTDSSAGRTFSITGPHGGGKSSLIVFLDSLLTASSAPEFKSAHSILEAIDPAVDERLRAGMKSVKAGRSGFIRAFATAASEPVTTTIARALYSGAARRLGKDHDLVPSHFGSAATPPEASKVKAVVQRLTAAYPLLLVIDEFGKNLEYFAKSGSQGDPFLLQELAELTQGEEALPLVVITLQHLSFDEYVQGSSTARRRA